MKYARITVAMSALVAILGLENTKAQSQNLFDGFNLVDQGGNIRKPNDHRDRYQMLGAYTVIDPKGDQMHFTYASPGAADYYRRNKKFADGTVLVKEILGTDHAKLTTGNADWATDTKAWFVMVKDAKGRYSNNPLWGDGWGWALFKSDAPNTQVATDYKKDCLGCHQPAKADDWVYVKGYPALQAM